MSLCRFSVHASLLRPLALWCLDTFGAGGPMLVGVVIADGKVHFHPIELDEFDPLADLSNLVAPDDWLAIVVVAAATSTSSQFGQGTICHAVDRAGTCATEFDGACGHRRSLHTLRGRLHHACLGVFAGE